MGKLKLCVDCVHFEPVRGKMVNNKPLEELPKTFDQLSQELLSKYGETTACYVLVKKGGMVLIGGEQNLARTVNSGLSLLQT